MLLTTVAFVALSGAALREWIFRHSVASKWFFISFVLIATVAVLGYALPDESESTLVNALRKASIATLALFPYPLYRLTAALRGSSRRLDVAAALLTAAVVVAALALPASEFAPDADRSGWFFFFTVLFLFQWTLLSVVVAVRLWTLGSHEPLLVRRRMRTLAGGAVGLSAALLLAPVDALNLATQLLALASALLFFAGFVNPRLLPSRLAGHPEDRFREAVTEMMRATTTGEITRALLPGAAQLVGARGAALLDRGGDIIGSHGAAAETDGTRAEGAADARRPRGGTSGFSEASSGEDGLASLAGAPEYSGAASGRIAAGIGQVVVANAHEDHAGRVELPLASSTLVLWTGPFTPVFGREELATLTSLGRLAELALERSDLFQRERQAHDALRRQIDFSRMLVDSSVDGILAFDRNSRYTLWNQGMERITRTPRADVIGRPAYEVFPFLKEIGEDRYLDEALAGREATSTDRRFDVPDTGAQGFFEARYAPLYGAEGDVVGGLAIVRDVTDRRLAEREREQRQREEVARASAEARNRMVENLQSVTDTALGHLTLDDMVTELLDRITEMLSMDTAALALLEEDDDTLVIRAATGFAKASPEGHRIPLGQGFLGRVAAERRPVAVEELTPAHTHTPMLLEEGVRSVLGVPLIVGGRLIGALNVGRHEPYRFAAEDTGWLQLVADRVALAVEQASIYEREHRIAETLQRSLLPESLPRLAGIGIAARYLAGGAGAVGGDWYDVMALSRSRVGLAMGDVVGHGINAASLMGQMRSALRAYALEDEEPSSVLGRLDRLLQSIGPTGMATLLYLVLDPERSAVTFASAGHPPPLVREPDGGLRFLEHGASVPLGVQNRPQFEDRRHELTPGSTLILYTDGLIERRGATLDEGFDRLRSVVEDGPESPEALCDHIVNGILPDDPADDTALLIVQLPAGPVKRLHLELPAEPRALASARDALRRWLAQVGMSEPAAYEVLVASGEACANAIEHAYGPGEASFELDAWLDNGEVAVSVRDFGQWRSPRGAQRGRGIFLMEQLMDTTDVSHADEGTTVRLGRTLGSDASQ